MIIDIPDEYWERLKEQVEGADYCYLCDCHPSSGHAADCPLVEAEEVS